jgi:hypothetical protein
MAQKTMTYYLMSLMVYSSNSSLYTLSLDASRYSASKDYQLMSDLLAIEQANIHSLVVSRLS